MRSAATTLERSARAGCVPRARWPSEYFTPADQLAGLGIDRLIRIGVGIEDVDDLVACVNWALHHEHDIAFEELEAWRTARARSWAAK